MECPRGLKSSYNSFLCHSYKSNQYLVFGKQVTKIALNNSGDSVRLLYPDNTIIKEVVYDEVPEGGAYVQDDNDNWVWTGTLTPGEVNIITNMRTTNNTKLRNTKK